MDRIEYEDYPVTARREAIVNAKTNNSNFAFAFSLYTVKNLIII